MLSKEHLDTPTSAKGTGKVDNVRGSSLTNGTMLSAVDNDAWVLLVSQKGAASSSK